MISLTFFSFYVSPCDVWHVEGGEGRQRRGREVDDTVGCNEAPWRMYCCCELRFDLRVKLRRERKKIQHYGEIWLNKEY